MGGRGRQGGSVKKFQYGVAFRCNLVLNTHMTTNHFNMTTNHFNHADAVTSARLNDYKYEPNRATPAIRYEITFDGKAEWIEYGVHADNTKREWRVSMRATGFGKRCVSQLDAAVIPVPEGVRQMAVIDQRAWAHAWLVMQLVEHGYTMPTEYLA